MSYGLVYRGNLIPLGQVPTVIGRSASCKIVLDDNEVSRKHARLVERDGNLWLEDLDSANGVLVNGQRIAGSVKLAADDEIRIGSQQFRVSRATVRPHKAKRKRFRTPYGQDSKRSASLDRLWDDEDSSLQVVESTTERTQLQLMARAAEELFDKGRADDAAALLEPPLHRALARAKEGRLPPKGDSGVAVACALRLARETGRGRWLDYLFTLVAAAKLPLSTEQQAELDQVVPLVDEVSPEPLDTYLAALAASTSLSGDAHRAIEQRLRALCRR